MSVKCRYRHSEIDIFGVLSFLPESSSTSDIEDAGPGEAEQPEAEEWDIENYPEDTEHPDDWSEGWLWLQKDRPPSITPFTPPEHNLLVEPATDHPAVFFDALFDDAMWKQLVLETNIHADQKQLGKLFDSEFIQSRGAAWPGGGGVLNMFRVDGQL